MLRKELIKSLRSYSTIYQEESVFIPRFISLLTDFPDAYQRSLITGHMTASSFIVDQDFSHTLLTHHKKLNKWLQPGGHADGDENILNVAKKEGFEETGLNSLKLFKPEFFDIDIHTIPEHKGIPEHFHYDIRFLFVADIHEKFVVSDESHELEWIRLNQLDDISNNNRSILRMKEKVLFLKEKSFNP